MYISNNGKRVKIHINQRLALLLALSMLVACFPAAMQPQNAQAAQPAGSIRNYIDRTGGTAVSLRVEWSYPSLYGVKTARAVWVDREANGSAVLRESVTEASPVLDAAGNPTGNYNDIAPVTLSIRDSMFKYDILYQIKIELYADVNPLTGGPAGAPLYSMETVFILGVSVGVEGVVNAKIREPKPGSRETGYSPALACSFTVPRVYVNADSDGGLYALSADGGFYRVFGDDPANPSNPGYATALKAIQKLNPAITEFSLILGLENFIVLTNTYIPLNEIRLYWDPGEQALIGEADFRGGEIYRAKAVNDGSSADDRYRIYLSGRLNADTPLPDDAAWSAIAADQALKDEIIPPETLGLDDFSAVLRYKELYPGSFYRVHAEIHYMAGGNEIMEIVGSGFELVSERPSTDVETALRIIVSKVSDEYVKVEVFRINLGADYVSDNGYKVMGTAETSSVFGPEMEVVINDFADAPESLQAYIKATNPTVRYYYQAAYTRANAQVRPVSARVPYILQESGGNAPVMPKGLVIEKIEYDPMRKMTDVTVSWDRPANWIAADSNNIYIEIDLNTAHTNLETVSELMDGEGGAHGSFIPLYRTVLAVRREEIQSPANDRLSYTIKGDELFKSVSGTPLFNPPPASPFLPDDLYNGTFWDGERAKGKATDTVSPYPASLLPNMRYYLTLRSVLWIDDMGSPIKMESNTSSAAAFTTYPTVYEVPLPYEFGVAANPQPSPPLYENVISMHNSVVDWSYASSVYKPPIPVYYELYISDKPDDPAPQLAGVTHYNADGSPFKSWEADGGWAKNMRLPPYETASQTGLAEALIAGRTVTSLLGAEINWDEIKYYNGEKLQPNKVYYFWLRTYIIETQIENGAPATRLNGSKSFSIMISATTPPWPQGSDDVHKRRIAPVDFAIAKDASGNLLITGESAVFEWSPTEIDVLYELVITSVRDVNGYFMPVGSGLMFGDPALAPGLDLTYESFIGEFSPDDGRASDRRLLLDPQKAGIGAADGGIRGFHRDPVTGKFSYLVDRWLFPNSLYYVSLRAVSRDPDPDGALGGAPGGATPGPAPVDPQRAAFYTALNNTSPFVSVPLTTLLLDAPFNLRTIIGAELGFSFADATPYIAAEYRIYIRGADQADYTLVGGAQGTLVKTEGIVYGRIVNLDFETGYDIRVTRGVGGTPEIAYQAAGLFTREPYHSVQVEWMGPATEPNDAFLRYQAAIISQSELEGLPSEQVEYFELDDLNLAFSKYAADGREYPYEICENALTITMQDTMLYRATILSKPTRLRDGSIAQRPLEPNMRYYIKVRTRKIARDAPDLSAFSKYAGPVEARTDFLQEAQDEIEERRRLENNLLDKLAEYERETYYIADAGDRTSGKFLLKEDKITGMINTSASSGYLIDVSENLKRAAADTLYIPGGVLLALQKSDKTLTIRFEGAEYIFSRNTIDLRYNKTYLDMAKKAGTQEFLIRLRESRAAFSGVATPPGNDGITAMHRLEASVIASNRSYGNIAGIINDFIYNERTGLLNRSVTALTRNAAAPGSGVNGYNEEAPDPYKTEEEINRARNAMQANRVSNDAYVAELANDIKSKASYLIGDILEGRNGYRSLIADVVSVDRFDAPLGVTLFHERNRNGKINPFISYDSKEWFKLTQNIAQRPESISFEVISPGNYSAVLASIATTGLPEGSDVEAALLAVASRYDLSDIFIGINRELQPELPVLNREAVLLYERVLNLEGVTFGMNIPQKITALGLSDIIRLNAQNAQLDRQRAAVLLMRMYSGGIGVGGGGVAGANTGTGALTGAGAVRGYITDAQSVETPYIGAVEFCIAKGLMKLSNGQFEPTRAVTRAELIGGLAAIPPANDR